MLIPLAQFNIQRPERVTYDFPLSNPSDLISHIKSKSLRSFLRNSDEVLAKNNIEWKYEDLTEQKFLEWLPYYKEKMEEHNYVVRAKEEWYQEEIKKGHLLKGLFFYQKKKLIGSGIFVLHRNTANFAYKASDRISVSSMKGSSFGSIIEFMFLKLAAESGVYTTASSKSRNAFGFINSLGYLDYKLRFGYKIRPSPGMPLLNDVPINESDIVLFFGLQNEKLILFCLQPESHRGKELFDKSRFKTSYIPFEEIYY